MLADKYAFVSLAGVFGLMVIGWLFSRDRKNVNWRVILWGVGPQFTFAFFIFQVPVGIFCQGVPAAFLKRM